jgi:putative thioredoxin
MQARAMHMQGETPQAITLLADAMKQDPTDTLIALDMVQIFIDMRELSEAESLLSRLPQPERDSATGRSLAGQLNTLRLAAKTDGIVTLTERIEKDADDYDAHFDMALCQLADNNYAEAMSHLFYLLENQADYRDGAPREMIVTLIDSLTEKNPQIAQLYRRQLASVLNE